MVIQAVTTRPADQSQSWTRTPAASVGRTEGEVASRRRRFFMLSLQLRQRSQHSDMDGPAAVHTLVYIGLDSTTTLGRVSLSSGKSHELLGSVLLHSSSHFRQGHQRIGFIILFIE